MALDALARARALRVQVPAAEHAHAALVEQPIEQPLGRDVRIDQLEVLHGRHQRAAFDPGVVLGLRLADSIPSGASPGSRSGWRARSGDLAAGTAAACRRRASDGGRRSAVGTELLGRQRAAPGSGSARSAGNIRARRPRGPCRRARPGPDSGSYPVPGRWSSRDGRCPAARRRRPCRPRSRPRRGRVSKRAQARTLPGVREIDHQHAHRPVGLGLQDEAAFELQRRAEQHGEHDGLAQQLGDRHRIVVARQDRVDRGAKPDHAAAQVERRRPRTAGWCRRQRSPRVRASGCRLGGVGHGR